MRVDGQLIYPLDDTYIHMGMAKNLAAHGVWGITRYEFSSSSSSPLWTTLLAGVDKLIGVRELAPLVLNAICAAWLLVLADRVLRRWSVPSVPRAIALVAFVMVLPLPALVLMGMEHVLHLLLSLAFAACAIDMLIHDEDRSGAKAISLCLLGALLGASRYEGFFLVGFVCLLLAVRRRPVLGVVLGLVSLVPLGAFGAFSLAHGSPFLPNSLLLKAGGDQSSAWQVLFKRPAAADLELFRRTPALIVLMTASAIGAVAAVWRRRRFWTPEVLACVMLAGMLALHAHFAFTSLFWVYRHDAYLVGFGIIAAVLTVAGLGWPAGAGLAAAGLAGLLYLNAAPGEWWSSAQTLAQVRTNYLEHYRAAEFIARHYPSGPVVVNDIGAVSYLTDARLLDMFGLGSVEPIVIRRANGGAYTADDVDRWTRPHHPAAAILQLGWGFVFPRVPASWIKVAEVEIVPSGQTLGFFAMSPDAALALRQPVEAFYRPLGDDSYRLRMH